MRNIIPEIEFGFLIRLVEDQTADFLVCEVTPTEAEIINLITVPAETNSNSVSA